MLPDLLNQSLPQGNGFIRSYVTYASQCSDAPELYHAGVAVTIFAAAVAKKLACPFLAGRVLVPNLYTLLVGPSRSSRKTSCMDTGIDILRTANPDLVIPVAGSYEEMVAQIRVTPCGVLTYREFGHFLKTTQRGYGEPIRTVMMDLYDWPPDRAYVRNLKKLKTVIDGPIVLCMLSSCSTDLLFSYTDTEEWTGGFFGRMLLLYGERDTWREPSTWPAARDALVTLLHQHANFPFPVCGGFSPPAWDLFRTWSRWLDGKTHEAPARLQTHIAGAPTLAAKIALLFAADAAEVVAGNGWLISLESMTRAILFVQNLYIPSIMDIGNRLTLGIWEKDRQRVLDAVKEHGQIGISEQNLLRRVRMEATFMEQICNTLRLEGSIARSDTGKGVVYRLSHPDGKGNVVILGADGQPASGDIKVPGV